MSVLHGNKKGMGLVEVIVAIMIASIGLIALLAAQPQSLNLAGKSDNIGRAAGIAQSELSALEAQIMNINYNTGLPVSGTSTVYVSRQGTKQSGDAQYTITRTVKEETPPGFIWRVRVTVTWPGNDKGVTSSLLVTRQQPFTY